MNIFRSDKATFALGLLVTLLGWHMSQIVADITAGQSVLYRIVEGGDDGRFTAIVHNVSRIKSLNKASFAIVCPQDKPCLVDDSAYLNVFPPNGAATSIVATPSVVQITTTLAAGGQLEFGAKRIATAPEPKFLYLPNPDAPLDINVFDGDSLRGFLVEHYIGIVTASLVFCVILFLILVILGIFPESGKAKRRRA